MAVLAAENVSYTYQSKYQKVQALKNVSCTFDAGKFYAIIGQSGSGKTTLLSMLAGLGTPSDGEIIANGKTLKEIGSERHRRENVTVIYQSFNLFPTLNILENVMYPMQISKKPTKEAKIKAKELLSSVGLGDVDPRKLPAMLSGGQQQRVAIARALVNRPRVLLLDEPLGALDLKLRKDMQNELKNIQRTTGITFIYVTHDQEEALSMSDTVVVMAEGRIQQIGTPVDIYNEPINAFVADFIGESNIVDGVMKEDFVVSFSGHTFDCVDKGFAKGEPVDVVIRPEDVDVVPVEKGMLSGKVFSVTFKGDYYEIIVDVAGFKWMLETSDYVGEGQVIGLHIEPDAIHVMKRSKFSDTFGDYSTFSEEMEHLSDVTEEDEQE